jgi:hypothetical protein
MGCNRLKGRDLTRWRDTLWDFVPANFSVVENARMMWCRVCLFLFRRVNTGSTRLA